MIDQPTHRNRHAKRNDDKRGAWVECKFVVAMDVATLFIFSYSLLSWEISKEYEINATSTLRKLTALTGDRFVIWFAKLKPCLVAMDACGAARDWARELRALGHDVRLIPPQFVAPYRKGGAHVKNDALDAEAICEAANSPSMRFAPLRSRVGFHMGRAGCSSENPELLALLMVAHCDPNYARSTKRVYRSLTMRRALIQSIYRPPLCTGSQGN